MSIRSGTRLLQILTGIILLVGCNGGNGPVAPSGGVGPKAAFTHTDPNDCVAGKTVLFDASGSTDSIVDIAQYVWAWGDNSGQAIGTTPAASHIFADAKNYRVTLTVIDKAGMQASTSQNIRILLPGSPPQACFTYQAPYGWQAGSVMEFDASCSSDVDGDISTYQWDWGDGSTPETFSVATAKHAFASESDFQVRLKVIDLTFREDVSEPTDISIGHPSGPLVVATAEVPGLPSTSTTTAIAVSGNYAYVAVGGDYTPPSLDVLDIQNPLSPTHVASLPGVWGSKIVISGTLAYLYRSDHYSDIVYIIDLSNPASPVLADVFYNDGMGHTPIAAFGHYLLEGGGNPPNLSLWDTTNPANHVHLWGMCLGYEDSFEVFDVAASGNAFYVIVGISINFALLTVDPTAGIRSTIELDSSSYNGYLLAVSPDSKRLVAIGKSTMYEFDISNALDPILTNKVPSPLPNAYQIQWTDRLYACDGQHGLYRINPDTPDSQALESASAVSPQALGIAVSGNYAFTTSSPGGLQVVDFSPPGPKPVASLDVFRYGGVGSADYNSPIALFGDFAYIRAGALGIEAINISQPGNPTIERDVYDNSFFDPDAMVVHNGYLYTINVNQMDVFDLADPSDPIMVAQYDIPDVDNGAQLTAGDGFLCLVAPSSYLGIFDITDPTNPQLVFQSEGAQQCAVISGSYLLVGYGWDSSITIYDMSNPKKPVYAGYLPLCLLNLQLNGRYLYGYKYISSVPRLDLVALDIGEVMNPVFLGSKAGAPYGKMTVVGNYAYILIGGVGAEIMDLSDPTDMHVVGTAPAPMATSGDDSYYTTGEAFRERFMYSSSIDFFQVTQLW